MDYDLGKFHYLLLKEAASSEGNLCLQFLPVEWRDATAKVSRPTVLIGSYFSKELKRPTYTIITPRVISKTQYPGLGYYQVEAESLRPNIPAEESTGRLASNLLKEFFIESTATGEILEEERFSFYKEQLNPWSIKFREGFGNGGGYKEYRDFRLVQGETRSSISSGEEEEVRDKVEDWRNLILGMDELFTRPAGPVLYLDEREKWHATIGVPEGQAYKILTWYDHKPKLEKVEYKRVKVQSKWNSLTSVARKANFWVNYFAKLEEGFENFEVPLLQRRLHPLEILAAEEGEEAFKEYWKSFNKKIATPGTPNFNWEGWGIESF